MSAADVSIGEVELFCRWLGSYNIPVILVTGDREAIYEANCYNPYRMSCCTKSLMQTEYIENSFLYNKLSASVDAAMKIEKEKCISNDSDELAIEFYNPDIYEILEDCDFYKKINKKIIFKDCATYMNNNSQFIQSVTEVSQIIYKNNVLFLRELRDIAKKVQKEKVKGTELESMMNGNLISLDKTSRENILTSMKLLAEQN